MGSEAWARYGMNKARGIVQKQARFDAGEAEGREAALAAEAGADREVLQRAATDAARGEAERLVGLVELQTPRRTMPWSAFTCALLFALLAWLSPSTIITLLSMLGGVVLLLFTVYSFRQPMRLPPISREQRDAILQQAQAAARNAGFKAAWVAGWVQGWEKGWKERD
ncbi:MAG: hypothetical protein QF576_01505 [Candidatus Poseidoniia archaeon]|nr:hypothetical protein [Candidatus Poseidoniia archaeon]